MNARDYLQRAWQIDARVARRIEERERLNGRLNALRGAQGSRDWIEAEAAVASLGEAIEGDILALCRTKREVNAAIDAVEDERYRRLLELRYRNYMTWEAIADEMGYELRHVYRLHREALRRVGKVCAAGLERAV